MRLDRVHLWSFDRDAAAARDLGIHEQGTAGGPSKEGAAGMPPRPANAVGESGAQLVKIVRLIARPPLAGVFFPTAQP